LHAVAADDREYETLDCALPHLGAFAGRPRKVREQTDPEHPGHTFDFAATRPDGRRVAIEVTHALHERFRADGAAMTALEVEGTRRLRAANVAPGAYALSTTIESPRVSELWAQIVGAARTLAVGDHVDVALGATLWHFAHPEDRAVLNFMPGLGGDVYALLVALVSDAIDANVGKLTRAADDGYETVLLVVPEWLPHGPHTISLVCDTIRSRGRAPVPDSILLVELYEHDQPVTVLW